MEKKSAFFVAPDLRDRSQQSPPIAPKMNDLMTDSFVGAAAAAAAPLDRQDGGGGPGDQKLEAFLREAEAAKDEMAALRDELSRLQAAHEASKALLRPGAPRAATQAALVRLLGSAGRLRARLASMDRRAPAPATTAATAGLRGCLQDLTAGVQVLRRQVSAERRGDAARCYLAVAGEAPTEEQLDRLVAAGGANTDAEAAVRAAMKSSSEAEEVEGGLLELQQLFLDMAALVESQGARVDDIERHVAAAAGDVGAAEGELREAQRLRVAARRRRLWLSAGLAVLLLVVLAAAAAALALALARRKGGATQLAADAADLAAFL
ncbi:syntaxin-related protein KNOLLE-like [Oryza glaberrima]|uniref:syntaxin-related protein KNOLLE-like n=1 Tax=Oryza glaberrima TaxID=4538 RepID=UPI00224C0854|nr:syntaxin-related protein KNOLLE-like [Oryza glaberrima]